MPIRDDPRAFLLANVAPLTEALAFHLAGPYVKDVPRERRPMGRPSKEWGDADSRKERLLRLSLEHLTPVILTEQERLYHLMNRPIHSGTLSRKWLLDELEKHIPAEGIAYPDRLRDWHRDNILFYTEHDQLEPQSTAALLLMRRLDRRKYRNWLPTKLPAPQSYVCWRRNARHLEPVPYEMPLLAADPADSAVISKPQPSIEAASYVLFTPWKGASWDDPEAWQVTDQGAIRWVGQPSEEVLDQWLSHQELVSLISPANLTDRARLALRVLAADFLVYHSSSDASSTD